MKRKKNYNMNNIRVKNNKLKVFLLIAILLITICSSFVFAEQNQNNKVIRTEPIEVESYVINDDGEEVSTENPNNYIHTESAIINDDLEKANKDHEQKFAREQKREKIWKILFKILVVVISLAILAFAIMYIIRNKKRNNMHNMNNSNNMNRRNNINNNNNINGNIF